MSVLMFLVATVITAGVLMFAGFMLVELVEDVIARLTNTYPSHSYLTPDEMDEMET